MHVSLSFPWRRAFRHHCSVHRCEVTGRKSGPAISNSAEHWLEAPVFDEHDQWLASRRQRFGEIASAHHASKAWRRPAYYE
jgi:hypothetical protein